MKLFKLFDSHEYDWLGNDFTFWLQLYVIGSHLIYTASLLH